MIKPNIDDVKNTLEEYSFPVDIIIEVTRHCNLRCVMCPYPNLKRPKGNMSFDVFKKIVDEAVEENPDARLWLAIMGEPLLLGETLIRFIRYAKDRGIGEVNINTNAVLMNAEFSSRIIDSGVDKVLVSIDAVTKDTYDKIRVGGDFDKVQENVQNLLLLINRTHGITPEVITQFIVMDENESEQEEFKNYWLANGAVVKIRPKLKWGDAVQSKILDETENETERFPCPWLTRTVSIHWDGSFAQCDADYEGQYSPGDLNTQTIKEVWDGELKRRRTRHWNGDFDFEPCKNCKDWLAGRSYFYYPDNDKNHDYPTRDDVQKANIDLHTLLSDVYMESEPHYRSENKTRVRNIIRGLGSYKDNGQLLDVGCGMGFIIDIAKDFFSKIQGIDITETMLKKVNLESDSCDIQVQIAEIENLPFADEHFDVVTAYAVLHHLHNPEDAFKEIYRVMKPGGWFYSDTDPNYYFWDAFKMLDAEGQYSASVMREILAIQSKDKEMNDKFGIDPHILNTAEILKHKKGGFREEDLKRLLFSIGFSEVNINYEWFVGEARVIHSEETKKCADSIRLILNELLPLSRHLFKYLRIVAQK